MSKSSVSLVIFAFLFWSTGCSTSQEALNPESAAVETDQDRSDSTETWVKAILVAGGVTVTVGAVAYLIPRIAAASRFISETGDFAPFFRLPGGYK
ncbi:MAG TPA: hypothetical protein VJB38_15105 [Bacteroidota bacterium]|nr:hypothetical protein [Bacteroidota bacterium]